MQVIGFNLTKIKAEKPADFNAAESRIETNIDFLNAEKAILPAEVMKDLEPTKFEFKFSFFFLKKSADSEEKSKSQKEKGKESKDSDESFPKAEVTFQGEIILSSNKEESKEIIKAWKKKQVPTSVQIPLINFIIRKCSTKAVQLQDELGLPQHNLRIPFVKPQEKK